MRHAILPDRGGGRQIAGRIVPSSAQGGTQNKEKPHPAEVSPPLILRHMPSSARPEPSPAMRAYLALIEAERSRDRHLDILVVEDDAAQRRAMELTLGHLGHLVVSASGLSEAARMLRTFDVDVVICDVRLSDGLGTELFELWPPGVRRKPTIAVSCDRDPGLADRCKRAGFDAFLAKPLDFDAVVGVLRGFRSRLR
jgi:CheY-like chemotaxis protein